MTALSADAIGIETVLVRFREMNGRMRQELTAAVTAQAVAMVGAVKSDKLSGQVLGQVTHRLVRSIHDEVIQTSNGVVATVGTDVPYGAFWEYGFQGTEQISAHLRTISRAFGRAITPREIMVKAHARRVNQPARSFLRSTLAEREPIIVAAMEAAVQRATQP